MNTIHTPLTFANVTSVLALVVALGGTSYAATQLPKNSVGSKQIKTSAVKSAEVRNKTLKVGDLAKGALAELKQPRAYGVIRADGTLVKARSRNVTAGPIGFIEGVYCITPTKRSGIDPLTTTIVATPEYSSGDDLRNMVQTAGATNPGQDPTCPRGFVLYTSTQYGSGFFSADSIALSFVIP